MAVSLRRHGRWVKSSAPHFAQTRKPSIRSARASISACRAPKARGFRLPPPAVSPRTVIADMPRIIQLISYVVPARYFVTILNGVFLKGVGMQVLLVEVLMLSAYAGLVFWGAARKMRLKVA